MRASFMLRIDPNAARELGSAPTAIEPPRARLTLVGGTAASSDGTLILK